MDEKLLLTVKEVSARTGWGRSFLYGLLQRQTLRSIRVGNTRRILVSDLESFVQRLADEADAADEVTG